MYLRLLVCTFCIAASVIAQSELALKRGMITGVAYDAIEKTTLSEVTIRVASTGQSTLANANGAFSISLPYGRYQVIFSRVGHATDTVDVNVTDSLQTLNVFLQSIAIELPELKVYERQYDPAQLIIREAIKRKKNILAMLQNYQFTAYTKLLVYSPDSAKQLGPIDYITETQMTGYWKQPNNYKEVINARRQSANMNAEDNLVTVGDILNFNQNRLEIGRYKVVSPTAEDALDYYEYYLLDTLIVDGRRLFHLELEPKSQTTPLFVGTIDIADSSFAIAGVDVGFNDVFKGGIFRNALYSQKLNPLEDTIWMPTEIHFESDIKIPIPGIPFYHFKYIAALHEYQFNKGLPKGVMNEFNLEVHEKADKIDSSTWLSQTHIPLTTDEQLGYQRIDSLKQIPKPIGQQILTYTLFGMIAVLTQPDLFHYNRVEGSYLGEGFDLPNLIPRTNLTLKLGYSFGAERWVHQYGIAYQLRQQGRLRFTTEYHDNIRRLLLIRPNENFNMTFPALIFGDDPLNYFHERGFSVGVGMNVQKHIRLSASFANVDQFSIDKQTDYSFFGGDSTFRENPEITEGTDRSIGLTLRFDNRPMIKNKNVESIITPPTYTIMELSAKFASPDFTHSHFDYNQYRFSVYEKFRVSDWGILTIAPSFGIATGDPPKQQRFTAATSYLEDITDFKTVNRDVNFSGDHMYSVYIAHDFGRAFFKKLHIPGLRELPTTFQVFGGAFWFKDEDHMPSDTFSFTTGDDPYSEVGFGISRIPPFSLGMYFTFKLSHHNTSRFGFALTTPLVDF